MRKIYLFAICTVILLFATSSIKLSHGGIVGYTGAPGGFGTCGNCHSGGSASTSGITITAVPAFTNNEYMPDSSYMITVTGAADGFGRYGFAAEILTTANLNAGTITANSAGGVKTANLNSQRKQAIHSFPQVAATGNFTFPWKAPAAGKATIYAIVNAVNGNGQTGGDLPLTPVSMVLEPMPVPVDTTDQDTATSIMEHKNLVNAVQVFPNPASSFVEVNYQSYGNGMAQTVIRDLRGKEIRRGIAVQAFPGTNRVSIGVEDLSPGIYFLEIYSGQSRLGQSRFVVQ